MADADKTLGEIAEQAEKEVDADISKETKEKDEAQEETSAPSEELSQEDKELQGLDEDTDFQEAKKELEKEMGDKELSFAQTKRFRTVYRKWKDAEREKEDLQSQIESSEPEEPTETELEQFAEKKGYKLTKAEQEKVSDLKDILDNVQKPEDRKWLENYARGIEDRAYNRFEKEHGEALKEYRSVVNEYNLDKSEQRARNLINSVNEKHGTKIDFDKDVDPELVKMIRNSKGQLNANTTDLYELTKEYLASNGVELGKKLSVKEQQELNDKKKKAATESSGTTSTPKVDDSKATVSEIFADELKKEGISSFS